MNHPRLCGVGDPVPVPAAEVESVADRDRRGNVEKRRGAFFGESSHE